MDLRFLRQVRRVFDVSWLFLLVTFTVTFMASPAQAYIDPGVGGMLLQLLLGGVAGVVVIMRLYWERVTLTVRKVFGLKESKEKSTPEDSGGNGSGS